jgi:glycosyltransferase involved in cell wall biosynthesis
MSPARPVLRAAAVDASGRALDAAPGGGPADKTDAAGRIVRIIARLNVGGPSRQVMILDERLRLLGWDSLLVHGQVAAGEATLEGVARERHVRMFRLRELGRRIRPWSDLVALGRTVALLFRIRPDVVHTHTAKAGAVGRIAAAIYNATRGRRHRCLVVHTFHGHVLDGYFGPVGTWLVRIAERQLARVSDRIVAISETQREDLVSRYKVVRPAQVRIVPLGLELGEFLDLPPVAAARQLLGLPPDAVVIGFVGRLVPIKRPLALIDAFERTAAVCPAAVLLIVGDGDLRPAVEREVARRGLSGRVVMTGWRHDLKNVYGAVDLVALTSRNEGTPVALIEAMAAGRPVVATDAGGVADLVIQDVTGLLVPADDTAGMAGALIRLVQDSGTRKRLGEAGRSSAFARHDAARLASDLDSLYRLGLEEKCGPTAERIP